MKQQTGATGVGANANANDGQDNSMCEEEASEGMMGMDSMCPSKAGRVFIVMLYHYLSFPLFPSSNIQRDSD